MKDDEDEKEVRSNDSKVFLLECREGLGLGLEWVRLVTSLLALLSFFRVGVCIWERVKGRACWFFKKKK